MLKRKKILSLLVCALMLFACVWFASCGSKGKTYAITWTIDENAVVVVEGYDKLPDKFTRNETLTFTAEGKTGYEIEKVVAKGKALEPVNGKYTLPVTEDLEIKISVEEKLQSIEVTSNPTKMIYYSGERIDATGMVVTATYETGSTKEISKYNVTYQNGDVLSRGDTAFTVEYDGKSAEVVFSSPIETKVTLNPAGGVIAQTALDVIQKAEGVHNYAVDEEGLITFTFADIPAEKAIPLPTKEEITFPVEEGGWIFDRWEGDLTAISNETVPTSVEITALYEVNLIQVTKVYMDVREGAPYLYVDVDFINDGKVFLCLYEGNDKLSLNGEDIEGKKGEKKTIALELIQLAEAKTEEGETYAGKWMDIRINADVHGVIYSTNVVVDPESAIAEVGDMVHDNKYAYKLHFWYGDNALELKVYFQPYQYKYTVSAEMVKEAPSLVIEGQANMTLEGADGFKNGKVKLTWGKELTGTVDVNGAWKIEAPLADLEGTATAGDIVFESADGATSVNMGKLNLAGCETIFDYVGGAYGSPRYFANEFTVGKYAVAIGADWNEPFLKVENLDMKITVDNKFELIVENGVVYGLMKGSYGPEHTQTTLQEAFKTFVTIQQYNTWEYLDAEMEGRYVVTASEGKFTLKMNLSDMNTQDGYYIHVGDNGNWNPVGGYTLGETVEANGHKYTLGHGKLDWATSLMSIWVESIG